jgi:hypothetical protein
MTTISYRDALAGVVNDPEELEVLLEWIDHFKNWGAIRPPKFPPHTLISLVEAVKSLKEQQLTVYSNPAERQ